MLVHCHWLLTPQRAAVHLPTQTMVVADLHLGYAETRRGAGDAVPLIGLGVQLAPLKTLRARNGFRRLVIAGDLFEKSPTDSLADQFLSWLDDADIDLVALVPGNHDLGWVKKAPGSQQNFPIFPEGFPLDAWRVLHGHNSGPCPNVVIGHWHPCVRSQGRKLPCYLVGPDFLVLPAFSRDAAGAALPKTFPDARPIAIFQGRLLECQGKRARTALPAK